MSQVENLQESREFVRHEISDFPQIMEREPETWWKNTAKLLFHFRNELRDLHDSELSDYFTPQIENLLDKLRSASTISPNGRDDFASLADHIIMKYSMEIASPFENREFQIEAFHMSLNDIVNTRPERFQSQTLKVNGHECVILHVKHPTKDLWQDIPLPLKAKVWHKGGPARVVLDIIANAPLSMQESEFPWNDFDALVGKGLVNKKAAISIGVDADGIEYMGEKELNFTRYCAGRDTTQNQVCLGTDGLYYSHDAFLSAVTGHTKIENEYVANKAIYGFDKMIIQGQELAKPRGMMRLVKAVVEGKALSFDYIPLNSLFDLGTNSLFLAKRWSKKEHFSENLQRMYYLLKQMNQIRPTEINIFDTLERAHHENPFFDFDSEVKFPIEVVRWKSRKLVKQIDREMGWKFRIPTGMEVKRTKGDDIPIMISLDGLTLDPNQIDVAKRWLNFLETSRLRTKSYKSQDLSAYEKVFRQGYADTDGLGTSDDDLISFGVDEI